MKAGLFRPVTLWPFPVKALQAMLGRIRRIVVIEASPGQIEDEHRLALSKAGVTRLPALELRPPPRRVGCRSRTRSSIGFRHRRRCTRDDSVLQRFERHAHGEGLKAKATHYCPGCGHGLVHKYIAEAIDELGVQDRTIAVSPVGCSVFLYYYLDVGNTQAAHGRAPAVAIGHKTANPRSVVISYQGDGDLASIGLAEIVSTAQLGIPITVIFVNNAIYGMTGGQMAPTTLMGQVTSTCPFGRSRLNGEPTRMAELIASLDGPIYVERVALFAAARLRATRAIKKAIQLQNEQGLRLRRGARRVPDPPRADSRQDRGVGEGEHGPRLPPGREEGRHVEPWFKLRRLRPSTRNLRQGRRGRGRGPAPILQGLPAHLDPHDIALKLAGAGGDGAQTAAMLVAIAAINEGFDATHIPSYGPECAAARRYADVHIAARTRCSPRLADAAHPGRVQRPEPREVRPARDEGRGRSSTTARSSTT